MHLYDNVRILYLSCNVKKPKPSAKLSKKCRNKRRSNPLLWYPLRKRIIQSMQFDCSNRSSARHKLVLQFSTHLRILYFKELLATGLFISLLGHICSPLFLEDYHWIILYISMNCEGKQLPKQLKGIANLVTFCRTDLERSKQKVCLKDIHSTNCKM